MKAAILSIAALLLTACGPMNFKPTEPGVPVSKVDFDRAKYDCQQEVNQAAQGRWAFGGLLFIGIVAAVNNASDRSLFQSCMAARGYTRMADN